MSAATQQVLASAGQVSLETDKAARQQDQVASVSD